MTAKAKAKDLSDVGGLAGGTETPINVMRERTAEVLERAVKDALDAATGEHGGDFRPELAVSELARIAPASMRAAGLGAAAPSLPPSFQEIAGPALARLTRRQRGEEKAIPLPWPSVSQQFGGGLWPGMHVLVSGTGAGKTQLALQAALHAATNGTPVAYIGLELDALQVFTRLAALQSKRVQWSALYRGECDEHAIADATDAAGALSGLPLYIEEAPPHAWPVSRLETLARAVRDKYPEKVPGSLPMLIVLDFLQLVGAEESNKRADLRERIGQAAYVARGIASSMNAAVLLVSSTSRANYATAAGKNQDVDAGFEANGSMCNASALVGLGKESGEIEYAADSVTVAVRRSDVTRTDNASCVVLATAKLRAGVPSFSTLAFNGTRFEEWPEARALVAVADPPKRNTPKRNTPKRNTAAARNAADADEAGEGGAW